MAEAKTKPTSQSVRTFLNAIADPRRREDAGAVAALMGEVSGEPPVMWGPAIVGFGAYRYAYESGRTGAAPLVAFSPRKAALTLYLSSDFPEREGLLARLGKHTSGKACVYVKRLADVDGAVLKRLVGASLAATRARHPP